MTTYPIQPNYADNILVASPSTVVRERVLKSLRSPARRFEQATGGAEALVHLESGGWQMLFLDRRLPDLDAEELGETVRRRFPEIEVVFLDAERNDAGDAGEPGEVPPLEVCSPSEARVYSQVCGDSGLDSGLFQQPAHARLGLPAFSSPVFIPAPLPGMIGNSRAMQPVYRLARLLAPRNTTVLITGPTGCGKEVVARALHRLSPRSERTFAVVNCAAIPETMLEAELFGYARGAFTGAMQSYAGRIQAAQGGTLFLDEIGEMPLSLQPKLLRFLEQKELQRLGSAEVVRVDARVLSATNAHLLTLVREGKFREDLYYRLCCFPIEIPPLRERVEDIAQLGAHFLEKCAAGGRVPQLSSSALELLQAQPWPGNIRELQNVMERALILSEEQGVVRPEHLLLAGDRAAPLQSRGD
jgi:DNA-binding NtrC family response regulator